MTNLVDRFCTPPFIPYTEYDSRAFSNAKKMNIPFEGDNLIGYCWGEGKTVLLIHGWGSRASHMAFLGRFLSKAGFRVVAYDAPAHSSTGALLKKTTSNMFEYCRAISTVAKSLGPLYAIAGHSFGAACAAFTISGISAFSKYKITVDKLILISTPPRLVDVYESFCRKDIVGIEGFPLLKSTLEKEFNFISENYSIQATLQNISADILIVHDSKDEEFPLSDIRALHESAPMSKLLVTEGSGHQKILANRAMMARVKEHLLGN